MKLSAATATLFLCLASWLSAATTVVNIDSGSVTMNNFSGTPLSWGNAAVAGDGTVLQLGYFTGASAANNFAGTWVPLTGFGTANTDYAVTTIGDLPANIAGTGEYGMSFTFDPAVAGRNSNLPAGTTIPLAIRFYDATTIAGSNYYNTVSNDAWLWKIPGPSSPLPPTIDMSLDDLGLEWEGGVSSAYKTTISTTAVPEPGRIMLGMFGLLALSLRRRRI